MPGEVETTPERVVVGADIAAAFEDDDDDCGSQFTWVSVADEDYCDVRKENVNVAYGDDDSYSSVVRSEASSHASSLASSEYTEIEVETVEYFCDETYFTEEFALEDDEYEYIFDVEDVGDLESVIGSGYSDTLELHREDEEVMAAHSNKARLESEGDREGSGSSSSSSSSS